MLDISAAQLAIGVVSFVVASLTGVYAWSARRERAVVQRVTALEGRLATLSAQIEGSASRGSLHALSLVVAAIEGDLKGVSARLDGIGAGMARIETVLERQEHFLLHEGRPGGGAS